MAKPTYPLRVAGCAAAVLFLLACESQPTEPDSIEVVPVPGLQGFEARLDSLRVQLLIPGVAAAIARDQ